MSGVSTAFLALAALAAALAPCQALTRAAGHGIGTVRTSSRQELSREGRVQALLASGGYKNAAAEDLVDALPGWGTVDGFNLFSGYITVDEAAGRALFYIFAEAVDSGPAQGQGIAQARRSLSHAEQQQRQQGQGAQGGQEASEGQADREGTQEGMDEPSGETPLVLWLNGGPGCSSIGGGFMSELGPWYPLPGGRKLQLNPHSWNRFAHMLFVESPAFVGFSYSNSSRDAIVGDARTAADLRIFMLGFLGRFPRHAQAPFYISGESYAGHYVPGLALAIVEGNKQQPASSINLAGFLVGNPWTDAAIDNLGAVDYWWSHALISDQTGAGIRANCNFSRIGPLDPHPAHADAQTRDELCDDFCNKAFDELGPINIYEIYADLCTQPVARKQAQALADALGSLPGGLAVRAAEASERLRAERHQEQLQQQQQRQRASGGDALRASGDGADPGYDPCVDDEVETYLNDPVVQHALHANQTVKLPWRWSDCTRMILYSREDLLSSMLPTYERLLQANLRILVYSGDVDGIVPVVGTRRWVASLRLREHAGWRPWTINQQVGGYVVEYSGSTYNMWFSSVRGAGHMVPYVQPARAAHMARQFLAGQRF